MIEDTVVPASGIQSIRISADKLYTSPSSSVLSPNGQRYIAWNFLDCTLRLYHSESNKSLAIFENLHSGHVTSCVFLDNDRFITGGRDSVNFRN